jgi:molecular chaperone DnaJ
MAKDYYELLGVAKGANDQEIKRAYRKLAMQHHPDKNKGDKTAESKFKEINQAYETLSDKQKRAAYDQFGEAGAQGFGGQGGFGGGQGFGAEGFDFSSFAGQGGFSDIFEQFFGGAGRSQQKKRGPRPGEDIEFRMNLTFEEAAFGVEKELLVTKAVSCDLCQGTGAEPGSKVVTCTTCGGTGEVRQIRQTLFGQMATTAACPQCYGEGRVTEKKCTKCNGATRVRKEEKVKVKIPAGVDNDSTVRLSGKGQSGIYGGAPGDLYVHIVVSASKQFLRNGYDVHSEEHIHFLRAILGAEIEIRTIHGKIGLRIPSGTQSGKVFKLKEYGIEKLRGTGKGDHYVKIIVDIPTRINRKERELYNQLAKETGIGNGGDNSKSDGGAPPTGPEKSNAADHQPQDSEKDQAGGKTQSGSREKPKKDGFFGKFTF